MPEDDQRNGHGDAVEAAPAAPTPPPAAALPVLVQPSAPARRVTRAGSVGIAERAAALPVVQAAAVAAGSFVAGAAVAGLVHRRHRSVPAVAGGRAGRAVGRRRGQRGVRGTELVEIVASRSLLVDIHLLGLPASDR